MSYLVFNKTGKTVGDKGMVGELCSAVFAYQVIGVGAEVEFSGSNHPNADINNDAHWIVTRTINNASTGEDCYIQHSWDKLRYKVAAGTDVEIYVAVGIFD